MLIAVFISPETAQLAEWKVLFSDPILRAKIAVVAVDEAHCISEWYIIIADLLMYNNVGFIDIQGNCF